MRFAVADEAVAEMLELVNTGYRKRMHGRLFKKMGREVH